MSVQRLVKMNCWQLPSLYGVFPRFMMQTLQAEGDFCFLSYERNATRQLSAEDKWAGLHSGY